MKIPEKRSPELLKSEVIARSEGSRRCDLAAMQANSTNDSNCELSDEIHTRLQLDLSTAKRDLRGALNNFWSLAANWPFSILDHQHTELIPLFEIYSTHTLHAQADALVRRGHSIPEVRASLEQELIPQTIELIVPLCVVEGSLLESSDLGLMRIDYSCDGYWEYWLWLTWEDFAATQAAPLDLDTWWRHQFQIVLRFPDHRKPFIARLQQHLTRSIVDWEPDAWRLKLESSTAPPALDARTDEIASVSGSSEAAVLNITAGLRKKKSKPRRPVRQCRGTVAIEDLLREIGRARPRDHRQVFEFLEGRVAPPPAEPFKSAGGWIAGYQKKPETAHVWLSKVWTRLDLPPFRRGPK